MKNDLIYDVGMHRAEDTEFYLAKGFRVVAVEALSSFCEEASTRLPRQIRSGDLTIVNAAISGSEEPVTFYVSANSDWGTICADRQERNVQLGVPVVETMTVPSVSLTNLLQEHGVPYFMKIDIEGADTHCLDALAQVAERPRYLSVESSKVSWREVVTEFETLRSLGYDKFKIVPQHRVPGQVCPNPSREGQFVERRFTHGCSGLFGEEAPGRWMSARVALLCYALIYVRYFLYGDQGVLRRHRLLKAPRLLARLLLGPAGWYDTHARLADRPREQ